MERHSSHDMDLPQGRTLNEWERLALQRAAEGETWREITDELKNFGVDAQTAKAIAKHATRRPALTRTARVFALIMAAAGIPTAVFSCMSNFQSDFTPVLIYISISSILRWIVVAVAYSYPLAGVFCLLLTAQF